MRTPQRKGGGNPPRGLARGGDGKQAFSGSELKQQKTLRLESEFLFRCYSDPKNRLPPPGTTGR